MWNRVADNWRPLFAIAEACGSGLRDLLLDSAETLIAQNAPDPQALGVMLLSDIRAVFEALGPECDRIASATLVASLIAIEERPWAGFGKRGDPLTPRRMADMLRPYAILSNSIRIGVETPKGYLRADFVRSPLIAASATLALNAALCFLRVPFMSCSRATGAF
jgi:putative DNA primase/helicase